MINSQFSVVVVPEAVTKEILAGPEDDPMKKQINKLPWVKHIKLDPPLPPLGYWQLGKGESEVIEYARLNPGAVALLDDRRARSTAEKLNIPVRGTLGIIVRAIKSEKKVGWDQAVKRLKECGIYIDPALIEGVRKELEKG